MKLQIIIPHYKEPKEVIKQLLDSIAIQLYLDDLEVIIVNDGNDVILDNDFLNSYPYKINYIIKEHSGVSAARNTGLKAATTEYIMFCDADDMFFNIIGISLIFKTLREQPCNILITHFYEEIKTPEGGLEYILHTEDNSPFIHGKIFNREFLKNNNIYFKEDINFNEDVHFCFVAQGCTDSLQVLPTPVYLWRWNDNSTTRTAPEYLVSSTPQSIKAVTYANYELLKKNRLAAAQFYTCCVVYNNYYDLCADRQTENIPKELMRGAELAFKDYWLKFKDVLFYTTDEEFRKRIQHDTYEHRIHNGFEKDISFETWINYIENLKEV